MVSFIPWKRLFPIYKSGAARLIFEIIREDGLLKAFKGGGLPRKAWMAAACALTALCLLPVPGAKVPAAAQAQADTKEEAIAPVVSAYIYDRAGLALRDEDAEYMTQMNFSFALIKDGKVSGDHWRSIGAFEAYMSRHPHILPVMAVGGWGADGFSQAAATGDGRAEFVESALNLMEEHGFLGIDIDWEYPGSSVANIESRKEDPDNLLLLLAELRAALDGKTAIDGRRRLLSVAVGGSAQYAEKLDCAAIGALADQVNVMTYDLRGSEKVTGHHTCLYPQEGDGAGVSAAAAMEAFHQAGIPGEKLMMGAAFYGRAWRGVESGENNGLGQKAQTSGNKSYGYGKILELMEKDAFASYWDEAAKAPFLFDGDTFVSFENTESIAAKGAYAKENGLLGIMFWEYGQDDTGILVKALYEALH